jgi:hypothetical protein
VAGWRGALARPMSGRHGAGGIGKAGVAERCDVMEHQAGEKR